MQGQLPPEAQEKVEQLREIQQKAQQIAVQKQQAEQQLAEAENAQDALDEIESDATIVAPSDLATSSRRLATFTVSPVTLTCW